MLFHCSLTPGARFSMPADQASCLRQRCFETLGKTAFETTSARRARQSFLQVIVSQKSVSDRKMTHNLGTDSLRRSPQPLSWCHFRVIGHTRSGQSGGDPRSQDGVSVAGTENDIHLIQVADDTA